MLQGGERLVASGMSPNQFSLQIKRDLDIMPHWGRRYDMVISTAAIHHHADLDPVLQLIQHVLKPGGFFVGGDWHNSLSTHPANVLELLDSLQWDGKTTDIESFIAKYPASIHTCAPQESSEQRKATAHIMDFWRAYGQSPQTWTPGFRVIEGHRPLTHYLDGFSASGMDIPEALPATGQRNPYLLLPGSELLCVMAAQKPTNRTSAGGPRGVK